MEQMQIPSLLIERIDDSGKVCELLIGCPSLPATHKVIFETGVEVLVCDRHALGIVAVGEYVNRTVEPAEAL
jgi:hypothetical protein